MTERSTQTRNVLVLGHPDLGDNFDRWAGSDVHVEYAESAEAAADALRKGSFDVVVSRASAFASAQAVPGSSQANAIIDSVDQGICIVGENGVMDWANPKLLSLSREVRDRVCRCCTETFTWAKSGGGEGAGPSRARRFSFTTETNDHYEVTATPVIDLHHRVTQVAAVVWDATRSRRLQHKIDAIDQAGQELLSLDTEQFARLDTRERLQFLEQRIVRCTQELLQFDNFVIFVLDRKTKKLEPVLVSGMSDERAHTELFASTEGNGICGYVAARGKSYICPDTSMDPRYRKGIDNAQSSLSVPLILRDEVVGVANFESTKQAAFSEDDRQFAEIFSRYIALTLHLLEMLVSERRTTTGRLGHDVMNEITAPLNDILTETENLVEDYIGHDDLRHRLRMVSENAVKIRETIKEITSGETGLLGARPAATQPKDPLLDGKRILLADDEEIIRDTVRDVLTGYGCYVHAVADGAAAIDLLRDHTFDLVLSDIKMPNKSGYEVFAAAKAANSATPVILTTGFGYDPNHCIVRAHREGLTAVLFKPFKVDQLIHEIRAALKPVATAS